MGFKTKKSTDGFFGRTRRTPPQVSPQGLIGGALGGFAALSAVSGLGLSSTTSKQGNIFANPPFGTPVRPRGRRKRGRQGIFGPLDDDDKPEQVKPNKCPYCDDPNCKFDPDFKEDKNF